MIALLFLIATEDLCANLETAKLAGPFVVMPPKCAPAQVAACNKLRKQLFDCFKPDDITTGEALSVSQQEKQLSPLTVEGRKRITQYAKTAAAQHLVMTEISPNASHALVRIVSAQTGEVVSAAKTPLGPAAKEPAAYDVSGGMNVLADKLAKSLILEGKRPRVAILPFKETGELVKKNGLGELAAAELTVRLRRDHGMGVVERSRLDAVLKEVELGQLGLIDAKRAPTLGGKLEAGAVIIGSVSEVGPAVHITAEVVDVQTALIVTAETVRIGSAQFISLASNAVVLRSKGGAAARSLLLPGWGQHYNGQAVKGWVFSGSVLALGGGIAATQVLSMLAQRDYERAGVGADFGALAGRVEAYNIARTVCIGVLGAVWIANVIDAYASGVTFDSATGEASGVSIGFGGDGLRGTF